MDLMYCMTLMVSTTTATLISVRRYLPTVNLPITGPIGVVRFKSQAEVAVDSCCWKRAAYLRKSLCITNMGVVKKLLLVLIASKINIDLIALLIIFLISIIKLGQP